MTITYAELRNRIAEHLTIKAEDMDLSDADAAKIDGRVTTMMAFLRERGLMWWATDAIPEACVDALTMIGAARTCALFGKQGQGYEGGDPVGRAMLAEIKPSADIETVKTLYY